jgi:hypothetical protein
MSHSTEAFCVLTGFITASWVSEGVHSLWQGALGAIGALILTEIFKYVKSKIKNKKDEKKN